MKATTVWALVVGAYSDKEVVGVFSTEDKANAAIDGFGLAAGHIHPFVIDELYSKIRPGLTQYSLHMKREGEAYAVGPTNSVEYLDLLGKQGTYISEPFVGGLPGERFEAITAHVFAEDEKHAVKIVNERRCQMIANGEWPSMVKNGERIENNNANPKNRF